MLICQIGLDWAKSSLILHSLTVLPENVEPPSTVASPQADRAGLCARGAWWIVLSGVCRALPERLGPRGVVSPVMGQRDESTPEVPFSLGMKPPRRHDRRAGVG